jgi:phosphoribosylformimino-5-aminoimidazole carboxamide ribotide isomerase
VLEGPNFQFYKDLVTEFPDLKILASGGVRGIDDIKQFQEMGLFAVIFGKAYYEGIIKLEEIEQFLVANKV